MLFNKLNSGFYDPEEKVFYGENFPNDNDLIEISNDDYVKFSAPPPRGHQVGIDENGKLKWIEIEGQIASNNADIISTLIANISIKIDPLQDAVDLGIATEDEKKELKKWKKYRVQLNRVDTTVVDMELPAFPEK